ncbi:MAG: hypothetical protein K6E94_05880 [Elusimicrobiaceae bacterium]|nr:hypothetical protein [Elusimicrobiaceae bacterium]
MSKTLKRILSVALVFAFMTQQSSFLFASTNVDNWSDLRFYVASSSGDYYVTESLTASSSPNGTLNVNNNGRTVTGYSLPQNSTNDTLVSVGSGVTFGLGNNIYGSIYNAGTLNYSGSYLNSGSITGSGTFNLTGSSLLNNNNIN